MLRPEWMLERLLDGKLRGYRRARRRPRGVAGGEAGRRRAPALRRAQLTRRSRRTARARRHGGRATTVRLLALAAPDFRPLLPLLRAGPATARRCRRSSDDVASRTARITIDARLQKATSDILKEAAKKGKAAAAVVIDVDTGQVLARAQWPDFDPGDQKFLRRLTRSRLPRRRTRSSPASTGPGRTRRASAASSRPARRPRSSRRLAAARAGLLGAADRAAVAKAGPDLRLPAPRRPGSVLHAARLVQGRPRPPRGPHPREHRLHRRPRRELQRLLRPARAAARARRPSTSSSRTASRSGWRGRSSTPGKAGSRDLALDRLRPGRGDDERLAAGAHRRHRGRRRHLPQVPAGHGA